MSTTLEKALKKREQSYNRYNYDLQNYMMGKTKRILNDDNSKLTTNQIYNKAVLINMGGNKLNTEPDYDEKSDLIFPNIIKK